MQVALMTSIGHFALTELLEGLNSPEREQTSADWRAIRAEALAKLQARKKPR
jgi:hypothetical protein